MTMKEFTLVKIEISFVAVSRKQLLSPFHKKSRQDESNSKAPVSVAPLQSHYHRPSLKKKTPRTRKTPQVKGHVPKPDI